MWSSRLKLISLDRTWSKYRCFGRAGQNVSRLVEPGRNIENCRRADRNISRLVELGGNIDVFGRAGRNLSPFVEPGRNKEVCGRADRNISRLVELGRNLEVLVAPVETYLAWWNLVET